MFAFVMVACYSRYLYREFTLSQAMGTFLRCMERGLKFFGGVATADTFDNMITERSERFILDGKGYRPTKNAASRRPARASPLGFAQFAPRT